MCFPGVLASAVAGNVRKCVDPPFQKGGGGALISGGGAVIRSNTVL